MSTFAFSYICAIYGLSVVVKILFVDKEKDLITPGSTLIDGTLSGLIIWAFWFLHEDDFLWIPWTVTILLGGAILLLVKSIGKPRKPSHYTSGEAAVQIVFSTAMIAGAYVLYAG